MALDNVAFNNNSTARGNGGDVDNSGQSQGGAIFIYDHANFGAVNGKSNASVSAVGGLSFTNNTALDNGTTGFVGDGASLNNDDNVYGLITGAVTPNSISALCEKIDPIPSLSAWGLVIFAFLLMSLSLIFLLNFNTHPVLANGHGWQISEQLTLPFDKFGMLKALEKTAICIVLLTALVFVFWGTLIIDDIIGLSCLTPILAYFIYLLEKFKQQ